MRFWKLGTIWGKGAPDFYDLIRKKGIILSHKHDGDPKKGEIVLIAKGFTVKALGLLLEDARPITSIHPEWEEEFKRYKIDFDDKLLCARANWVELNESDRLWYQTQDGICQVHKSEITTKALSLYNRYIQRKKMENIVELLKSKGQIVLQGPPGTGKTYQAQEMAHQIIFSRPLSRERNERDEQSAHLEASEQFRLVQFHPAYSYEDFVRGISAKAVDEGIVYEVENRILAEFAQKALKNWENSQMPAAEYSRAQQVMQWAEQFRDNIQKRLDESNEKIELTSSVWITRTSDATIRYSGEWKSNGDSGVPLNDLVEMYLHDVTNIRQINELPTLTKSAKGHPSYWLDVMRLFREYLGNAGIDQRTPPPEERITSRAYVLVIDEINRANLPSVLGELIYALEYRNKVVESIYDHPLDGRKLRIPPNLYIIGTMNTADRSVGHIDYAIRRRFAFVDVLPDESVVTDSAAKKLFSDVNSLFQEKDGDRLKYLSGEFEADQVRIGHSYFLASGEALKLKLDYEIKPILREYVRDGILNTAAKEVIENLAIV